MDKIIESHNLIAYSIELAESGDFRGAIAQVQVAREISPIDFSVAMAAANMCTEISQIMIASKHGEQA